MNLKRFGLGLAATIVVAVVLIALFGGKKLDSKDAASKIQKETVTGASVACEDDVAIDVGTKFTCTATVGGKDYPIPAEITSDKPEFRYLIPRQAAARN